MSRSTLQPFSLMKTYPMFSVWIAKEPISMLSPETKRTLRIAAGDRFVVTNSTTSQALDKFVRLGREKGAHVSVGYPTTFSDLNRFFAPAS